MHEHIDAPKQKAHSCCSAMAEKAPVATAKQGAKCKCEIRAANDLGAPGPVVATVHVPLLLALPEEPVALSVATIATASQTIYPDSGDSPPSVVRHPDLGRAPPSA
jgi:hypothetical protein